MKLWHETNPGLRWEKNRWVILKPPDESNYLVYRFEMLLTTFPTLQQAKDFCDE
jgi:hypothetical protein